MKKFIKEHLVQTWIVASIVFAILIHILFVTDAPCDKLQAQWGAGDILTYASTVALGLLAVWQNQKFKEENDKSQERLEKLTIQANELAVIGKIIDDRQEKIQNIQLGFSEFEAMCSVGPLQAVCDSSDNTSLTIQNLILHGAKLTACQRKLINFIRSNDGVDGTDVTIQINKMHKAYQENIEREIAYLELPDEKRHLTPGPNLQDLTNVVKYYIEEREFYLLQNNILLNMILYQNMSLSQIKELISNKDVAKQVEERRHKHE